MTTTLIPVMNLTVGPHVFGPADVGLDESLIEVDLDRTLTPGGLNARTADTTMDIGVDMSFDGGLTWVFQGGATGIRGGTYVDPDTGQVNTEVFGVSLWNPGTAGRTVRATVTVYGPSSVRISGSLIVS
jgi:hypothetical protein